MLWFVGLGISATKSISIEVEKMIQEAYNNLVEGGNSNPSDAQVQEEGRLIYNTQWENILYIGDEISYESITSLSLKYIPWFL